MSYEVRLRRAAQKGLDNLPEPDYETVAEAIATLEENPRPPRVKKLADSGLWRIRVGQHRIVYAIDDEAQLVTIVRVARRKERAYMKAKYTVDMLCADHDEMAPLMELTKGVRIPQDEWPRINIEGTTYSMNPNIPDARTMRFFMSKYGRVRGSDYGMRFLSIMWFIIRHRRRLVRDGLVRCDDTGRMEVCEELLQVLLESFSPPKPPVIFPTSSLAKAKRFPEFDLGKVIKSARLLIKD